MHYLIDFDTAYMADLDYERHELEIRKEYPEMSDEEYRQERLKVSVSFL